MNKRAATKPPEKTPADQADDVRLRLLVENIGDILWFQELNPQRYTYVSPAFERIWGLPVADLQRQPRLWVDAILPEDRRAVRTALKLWFKGEKNDYEVQYRVLGHDGQTRWLADRGIILARKDGKPYQIGGITRDITQTRLDEALRARLAAVVESSDDAIITMDLESIIQTWNNGAERIFGYTVAEVIGKHVSILRPAAASDDEAIFEKKIRRGRRIQHYETRRQTKEGRIIDISLSISPLKDGTGNLTGFSKISRDITERNLARKKFSSLLEAAPDGFIIMDAQGIIQLANARAERLFGRSRKRMHGSHIETLLFKSERQRHSRLVRDFLTGHDHQERFRSLEMQGLRQDGNSFPMELSFSQIETAEGPLIIIDICDITARKQAEQTIRTLNAELEMRVQQRTAELSLANEELRSLLETRRRLEEEILSISEREQRRIGQDLHDDLGQQLAGAWMMSSVLERNLHQHGLPEAQSASGISALLEKALAQTRSLARGLHPVAPADGGLITALSDLAARNSDMFSIDCRYVQAATITVEDQMTATHLYRIAQEAVSNAVKHGRAKKVRISLSFAKGVTKLSVRDDGCGISQSVSSHQGMGLRIMRYRAGMIAATLTFKKNVKGGTSVICALKIPQVTATHTYA